MSNNTYIIMIVNRRLTMISYNQKINKKTPQKIIEWHISLEMKWEI